MRMKFVFVIAIILALSGFIYANALAYNINGQVDDWGITLSSAVSKYYLNDNHPSGGNDIDVEHEDNADDATPLTQVGPGYSYGNLYDAEALYFDNDHTYGYFALITGVPQTGAQWGPGDIFINTDANPDYEYGLKISDGQLYSYTSSENVYYDGVNHWPNYSEAGPWRINGNLINSPTEFAYSTSAINGHYVLEGKFLLSAIGLDEEGNHPIGLHWTMQCGNDYLTLNGDANVTPEPASLSLLGLGLLGLFRLKRKGKR